MFLVSLVYYSTSNLKLDKKFPFAPSSFKWQKGMKKLKLVVHSTVPSSDDMHISGGSVIPSSVQRTNE
jgi:hypothetical protein